MHAKFPFVEFLDCESLNYGFILDVRRQRRAIEHKDRLFLEFWMDPEGSEHQGDTRKAADEHGSWNPLPNVGINNFQISVYRIHRLPRFDFTDDRDVVKGVVALAAHPVEEVKRRGMSRVEMLLGEFQNCNVVAKLDPRALPMAQHQRQGGFQDSLIGRLVGSLLVDLKVLPGRDSLLFRVSQELLNLPGIDLLLLRRCHSVSTQCAFRSKCR